MANAGLILPATLAPHLELQSLIDAKVHLPDSSAACQPGRKALTLVHSMIAGGDCIDDANVLRAGSSAAVLGHVVMAPSTLGTFLRAHTFGNVLKLDSVNNEALRRAWTAGVAQISASRIQRSGVPIMSSSPTQLTKTAVRKACQKLQVRIFEILPWLKITSCSDALGIRWLLDFGDAGDAAFFEMCASPEYAGYWARDGDERADERDDHYEYREEVRAERFIEWLEQNSLEIEHQPYRANTGMLGLKSTDPIEIERQARFNSFEWKSEIIREDAGELYDELVEAANSATFMSERMKWRAFEVLVRSVFRNQGYDTLLGSGSHDGGVDLELFEHGLAGLTKIAVQIKRYSKGNKVGLQAVQAIYGASVDRYDGCVLVTSSSFLPGTKSWAATREKSLVDGKELREMMRQDTRPEVIHVSRPTSQPSHREVEYYKLNGEEALFWETQRVGKFLSGIWEWDEIRRTECLCESQTDGLWIGPNGTLFESVAAPYAKLLNR